MAVVALVGASCAPPDAQPAPETEPEAASSPESRVVEAYTAAFNAHDVAAMSDLMSPDIVWLSVVGDSVIVEASGADDLAAGMTAYFDDFPDVLSDVVVGGQVGPFVHATETASWSRAGVRPTQSSLSTYEVRDGRIRRVWYFPAA